MADRGKCTTIGCEKPASNLQCPICLKTFGRNSFFCGQDCFKGGWTVHKLLHQETQKKKPHIDSRFAGYRFTGGVKAAEVSPMRKIPEHIPRPDYASDLQGTPHSELAARGSKIEILSKEDQEKARTACRLGREVLDIAGNLIKPGITTEDIDIAVHQACIDRECYPSPLNYRLFPKSCCTSVNEVICHGIPDARTLVEGDIVNVDITVYKDGFHGDLNETFFVGKVNDEYYHLIKTTYECLQLAIQKVRPGELYRNIGNVITKHATENKLSVVRSYCGHGIHRLFHTAPNVPHYSKNKAVGVMKAGHCFTIEPMINMGGWQDVLWPDDWTSATRDGKFSAQFEHTLLVTETGCEILTRRLEGVEYKYPFYIPGDTQK